MLCDLKTTPKMGLFVFENEFPLSLDSGTKKLPV